ncbi:MAG TPA: CehA/McbA family metallohydrolase [Gemmatimonadaceae bacterium]|jgi:TolB protein
MSSRARIAGGSVVAALLLCALDASRAEAQWKNRYPKLVGSNHHVYVEGYELPVVNVGASDPAESPNGRTIAIGSRGWLWLFDKTTGTTTRLTRGGKMDSRPSWSPDGRSIAFVRDDGNTLAVVIRDLTSGNEREIEKGFAMDPAYSADGKSLFYASNSAGGLDIWRIELASGTKTRITTDAGLELRPQPHPDGKRLVYMSKSNATDQIRIRNLDDGKETVLASDPILAQTRPALSPDGASVAYTWPNANGWEMRLVSVEHPGPTILLVSRYGGEPIAPSWSADGKSVYYMEADREQRLKVFAVPKDGGATMPIAMNHWVWGEPTGRVIVRTHLKGQSGAAPARLRATDASGHPIVANEGQARSDGQNGIVFFYSPGVIELEAPAGNVTIGAVQGLVTPEATTTVAVAAGQTREVDLELDPVWDARAAGWYSGDHHFHLNFGGQFPLVPDDLLPLLRGEGLDVATPLIGNLANRNEHADFWPMRRLTELPFVRFGQEVRPSLGHTGLIGDESFFYPWTYGAGTQLYALDDISNVDPLTHARSEGGMGTYMHPVQTLGDPFATDAALASIPTELVADAVIGALDALEVACVWSDELATADVWHRFLNLGLPIVPNAGTDVMTDFYRTPALGATRVYVKVDGLMNFPSYFAALKSGHSFVTNGPMLDLKVGSAMPGDVVQRPGATLPFSLDVRSAVPVDSILILVNGAVAFRGPAMTGTGPTHLSGNITVPAGGWIAAVAIGGATKKWPAMDSYAYAHTAPIWIGRVGSSEPNAAMAAAKDLLRALDAAERRVNASYGTANVPKLRSHFRKARELLQSRLSQ